MQLLAPDLATYARRLNVSGCDNLDDASLGVLLARPLRIHTLVLDGLDVLGTALPSRKDRSSGRRLDRARCAAKCAAWIDLAT